MEEYRNYNITEQFNYNEFYVSIVIKKNINTTNTMARTIAEDGCNLALDRNGFIVEGVFGENSYIISNEDKELYEFEVCIKNLPKPLSQNDIKSLSKEEIKDLLLNPSSPYITTEKDYKKIDWNITEVYEMLKKQYPNKDTFKWDSLSYGIEEINS